MKSKIFARPSFAAVELTMDGGDKIKAEAGAMAWMTSGIKTEAKAQGGFFSGIKRMMAGESFFQTTFSAERDGAQVTLVPGQPGDIIELELDGELFLESGAYLASSTEVEVNSKFEGLKGLFSEGLFVVRCTGRGPVWFSAYGDVTEIQVDGKYIVDNGYAVAWEPTLNYQIIRGAKIRSFLFSDQLVMEFSGQGTLWVQSRSARSLSEWVHPFRPPPPSN